MKQENQIPEENNMDTNNNAMLACKRSRDSLATVDTLDGDLSDKRLRFTGKSSSPLFAFTTSSLYKFLPSCAHSHLHTSHFCERT